MHHVSAVAHHRGTVCTIVAVYGWTIAMVALAWLHRDWVEAWHAEGSTRGPHTWGRHKGESSVAAVLGLRLGACSPTTTL